MEFAASLNQSKEETPLKSLQRLNLEYVRSVEQRDVAWFDANLAPDFMNSNPDGSLVDRAGFLAQIGRGAGVSSITAHDILIRMLGDLAIVHAATAYTFSSGEQGAGRYTDIWSKRSGTWLCVAAQVTVC
jgi:ketosteroid isomerase-like protein